MLCYGRHAGRNEGIFGEAGSGVQREVANEVEGLVREVLRGRIENGGKS
jgi:hypothetical protein